MLLKHYNAGYKKIKRFTEKALVSRSRLGHSGKAPDGVTPLLGKAIQIG